MEDKQTGAALLDAWLDKKGHGAASALAFRLGISDETISRWRRGSVFPSFHNRRALSNATAGAVPVASWEVEG